MKFATTFSPSQRSWRPYDAAPAVRAVGGLRRGVLLGALAGVQDPALIHKSYSLLTMTELSHDDDGLDEFATFWWGPETDKLTVTEAIESGQMTAFIRTVSTWLTE